MHAGSAAREDAAAIGPGGGCGCCVVVTTGQRHFGWFMVIFWYKIVLFGSCFDFLDGIWMRDVSVVLYMGYDM